MGTGTGDKVAIGIAALMVLAIIAALVTGALTNWYGLGPTSAPITTAVASTDPSVAAVTVGAPAVTGATGAPAVTGALAAYSRWANRDLAGTDVSFSSATPDVCATLCSGNSSCTFFVTDSAGKQCWLRKGATGFLPDTTRAAYAPAGAATPPPLPALAPTFNWDLASAGGDIGGAIPVAGPDACGKLCADQAGCAYYVTDSAGLQCWLKSAGGWSWTQRDDRVSYAAPGVLPPYTFHAGYDAPGNDIASMAATPSQCAAACGASRACRLYVTDAAGATCWLKSAVGTINVAGDKTVNTQPQLAFNPPVVLFADCNYGGRSAGVPPGDYGAMPAGFPNDALSSLRIPPGFTVTLYANGNFGGKSVALTGNVPCLVAQKFNDITSSLRFRRS